MIRSGRQSNNRSTGRTPAQALADVHQELVRARSRGNIITASSLLPMQRLVERALREERRERRRNTLRDIGSALVDARGAATAETSLEARVASDGAALAETEFVLSRLPGSWPVQTSENILTRESVPANTIRMTVTEVGEHSDNEAETDTAGSILIVNAGSETSIREPPTDEAMPVSELSEGDLGVSQLHLDGADTTKFGMTTVDIARLLAGNGNTEGQTSIPEAKPVSTIGPTGSAEATAENLVATEPALPPPEEEMEQSFGEAARREMARQMDKEVRQYFRHRERVFYQEQGYCNYAYMEELQPDSPLKASYLNVQPAGILVAGGRIRRARQSTRATLPRQQIADPSVTTAEHTDQTGDFLLYLVFTDAGVSGLLKGETSFQERFLHHELAPYSFTLALEHPFRPTGEMYTSFNSLYRERFHFSEPDADVLAEILDLAVTDGMDICEVRPFQFLWTMFWESHPLADNSIAYRVLPISVIVFWVALRRGWGAWRPSDGMLRYVRDIFQMHTGFTHLEPQNTSHLYSDEANALLANDIRESTLAFDEQQRLFRLIYGAVENDRARRIFEIWNEFAPFAADTRSGHEANLLVQEVRRSRLERLIIEEGIVNARRIHQLFPRDLLEARATGQAELWRQNTIDES